MTLAPNLPSNPPRVWRFRLTWPVPFRRRRLHGRQYPPSLGRMSNHLRQDIGLPPVDRRPWKAAPSHFL